MALTVTPINLPFTAAAWVRGGQDDIYLRLPEVGIKEENKVRVCTVAPINLPFTAAA